VHEQVYIFRDVAMVFAGALIAGLIFWRLRQPLILGYSAHDGVLISFSSRFWRFR
jgi:hypothetical protein